MSDLVESAALETDGWTSAMLVSVGREAAMTAMREDLDCTVVRPSHIRDTLDRLLARKPGEDPTNVAKDMSGDGVFRFAAADT